MVQEAVVPGRAGPHTLPLLGPDLVRRRRDLLLPGKNLHVFPVPHRRRHHRQLDHHHRDAPEIQGLLPENGQDHEVPVPLVSDSGLFLPGLPLLHRPHDDPNAGHAHSRPHHARLAGYPLVLLAPPGPCANDDTHHAKALAQRCPVCWKWFPLFHSNSTCMRDNSTKKAYC